MAIFLLELPAGTLNRKDGVKAVLVEAGSSALALSAAKARFTGDSDWGAATVTTVAAGMAANYSGCRYRVRIQNANGTDIHDVSYTAGAETVTQVAAALAKLLRGRALGAAILDDGGTLTDDTTAANDDTANDVDLTPATPNANDAFQFGMPQVFGKLTVDVGTAGVGTYTETWEYWNGSAWAALTGVTDGTTSFKTAGLNRVTFTIPTNWATKTETGFAPLYYVRAKLDAGTVTTAPKATRVWAGPGTLATSSTNTLTAAAASDTLGDKALDVTANLPNGEELVNLGANDALVGAVTDEGAAGAALTVVLLDNAVIPTIVRAFGNG